MVRPVAEPAGAEQDKPVDVGSAAGADDRSDRPQAVQLTARQTLVAIAERDVVLVLIAAGLALRPDQAGPALAAPDAVRLRRVAGVLHRHLSADGRAAVRARVTAPGSQAGTADTSRAPRTG